MLLIHIIGRTTEELLFFGNSYAIGIYNNNHYEEDFTKLLLPANMIEIRIGAFLPVFSSLMTYLLSGSSTPWEPGILSIKWLSCIVYINFH